MLSAMSIFFFVFASVNLFLFFVMYVNILLFCLIIICYGVGYLWKIVLE